MPEAIFFVTVSVMSLRQSGLTWMVTLGDFAVTASVGKSVRVLIESALIQ